MLSHMQEVPGSGDSPAGGFPLPRNNRTANQKKAEPAATQSLRLLSSPLPRVSFTQVNLYRPSGLSAVGTEAGLKFSITASGGQSVMMTGTIPMPPSSAACWATPAEQPLPTCHLVSGSLARSLSPGGFPFGCKELHEFRLKEKDWFKQLKSPAGQCLLGWLPQDKEDLDSKGLGGALAHPAGSLSVQHRKPECSMAKGVCESWLSEGQPGASPRRTEKFQGGQIQVLISTSGNWKPGHALIIFKEKVQREK